MRRWAGVLLAVSLNAGAKWVDYVDTLPPAYQGRAFS